MVWDISTVPTDTFDRIALFFDFGDVDTSFWYFDDILASTSTILDISKIESNDVQIFPNPTKGLININLDQWISGAKPVTLKLYNATGQLM